MICQGGLSGRRRRIDNRRQATPARVFARADRGMIPPAWQSVPFSTQQNEVATDVYRTLTGQVIANFVDHLLRPEFTLTILTATGVNQVFILAKDVTGLWIKFHSYLPVWRRGIAPPVNSAVEHMAIKKHQTVKKHISCISGHIEITPQ